MNKAIASLVIISAVCAARADYTLERSAAKDGLLRADGVAAGSYYVRLEGFSGDDATTRAKVWHEGRRIEFVRGGPWMNDNGTQRMTLESRPVEVKPGEAFRIDRETPGTQIVLAEKPLTYAPQRVFTNMALDPEVAFAVEADFGASNVAVAIKSYLGSPVKGRLRVKVTDYYGKTLAEVDRRDVELAGTMKLDVPYEDNCSGQFRAAVDFEDGSGRKVYRVFARLADARTPHRELMRMNEGWTRASGAKAVMPAEIKEEEERFCCRRLVPASFAGRRVVFKALRVVGEAALFVNGKEAAGLATDGNISGEMEADITSFVRIGETNDFLIVAHRDGKGVMFRPGRVSAIGELSLESRGENAIGRVSVVTLFREKKIRVKAEHPDGFTVRNSVWRGDERLLSFADEAKWENPPLWGPFGFPLLKLVTELVDANGNVVDEKLTRFAFREFWAEGMALMWNGHRVKGDARAFVSTWGWSFDQRCKRQFNCDIIWANKLRGVKFLRHIYNSSEFLDFCDEAGIPCAVGFATIANPSPEKSANKEFWAWKEYNDRCLAATLRNHPSVMTWYITNEYYAESEDRNLGPVQSALRNIRAFDPFHFAETGCDLDLRGENNIISTHYPVELLSLRKAGCYMPYSFYWRDVDRDFSPGGMVPFGQVQKVCNVYADSPLKWGEKPIFVNETCWDFFFSPPFGWTRLAGDEVFCDPRFCDKWHIETEVEAVRGHRDADVTLWTPWRWYHIDPQWRVSPEIDVVNIQRYSRFYEGCDVKYDVNVFYDRWRPASVTWFWRLEDAEGKAVASSEDERIDVDTSAFFRKRIFFKAPLPGAYALRFGLKGLCEKTLDVAVTARGDTAIRRPNVFGADDRLSEVLLDRAASGETIVILARDDYPGWLPEIPSVSDQSAAILRTYRTRHPILKGFKKDDLKYFYPKSIACDRAFAKPAGGNAKTILEFGGADGLVYSALVEVPCGKGCFLYSRLVLEPEENPVAEKLLENMASYKNTTVPGKALFLTDGRNVVSSVADALTKNYGAELDVGGIADIGKYNAVFVDGGMPLSNEDFEALAASERPVIVFGACAAADMKTRPVGAKSWSGRAVRIADDLILDGLTNQELMWRKKFSDQKTAFAELAEEEFDTEDGVLMYPAYVVRRGNIVFTTLDPANAPKDVASQVSRLWATILGNVGVRVKGFSRPYIPKGLFYDSVDLTAHLDRTLCDEKGGDGKGSWNDQGPEQCLPAPFFDGHGWVGPVPYEMKREGPCSFVLKSEYCKSGNEKVEIQIGRRFDTLNWLCTAAWVGKGKRDYTVRVNYADGTSQQVDGTGGVNLFDWVSETPNFTGERDTVTALRVLRTKAGKFTRFNIYSTSWVNPHPEKTVRSVEFLRGEKNCAVVGIFAVTLGARESEYSALSAEERERLHERFVSEALAAKEGGDRAKAIALYEKAVRAKPVDLGIYRSIAALYEADGDWEGALATYRRSLAADYNQPDLWDEEKRIEVKVNGESK